MARDSLPTRQASAWGNKMARTSKVTAPQSSSLTGVRPSASTKRATTSASGIEVLADPYEINNTAGPSRLPAITSKAPLNDRKGSLNKQQQGASRSRIPVNPNRTVAYAADPKGKGRAIDSPAPPRQRKSPVRSATKQNYSLHESASSEEDEEMFLAPKMNTSRIVKRDSEPVQTPRNARGTAPRSRVTPSSAVRGSGHARTASLAPSEGWSAMKPIPLKTVVLSSPPRPDRLSESESSSASEDEVRLIENPTTSARKRKAAAGEYTWDERSRSCIPKRERSRSRSLTASAHRLRPVQLQNDDDEGDQDSPASNRSHLQERVFPTSENDNMLKHLLTNHLYDRARLEHSTPAKHEGQEPPEDPFQGHLDPHSTFTEDLTNQILDLPDIQHEDLAAEQPIFDFSYSGLPDDESDDEVFSRRTAFSSSDDGFEQSIIHLQGINEDEASMNVIGDNQQEVTIVKAEQPEVENVSLDVESVVSDVTEMPLDNIDPNRVSEELPEPETLRKSNSIHSETVLESIRAYVKQAGVAMSQTVVNKIGHDGDDHQDDEFGHERHHQQQRDEEETVTRSSSVISDLPPSSPPPLPDYSAAQELPSDIDDIEEVPEVASSPKPSAHPVSHFAGPLSPKTTNRPAQSQSQRLMSPSARSMRSSSENPPSKRGIETYESLMKGRQAAPLSSEVKELGTPRAQSERLASPHPIASIRATNRSVSLAPSPSRHQTPAKLGYLTNDQLFAYAKSPRVPQMTPIRLRTVSPAPVSNFSMVETGATPTQSVQKASMTEPDMDKQTSQDPLMQKVEVVSPSQPPKRPSNSPASALLSPLHARASASPLSPSEPSRASRSLSPAQSGALSRMHTPSVSMRPPQLTPTLNASDVLDRPSLNIEQPSLLVPPSPSLPDVPRSIRSPSPNIVAEKATMDLLARVRALRSPSLAPLLPSSEFVDGQSGLQILKPSAMPEEKASDLSLNVEEDNAASMTPVAVAEANLELVALRAVTGNTADLHKSPEPISSARSVPEKEQALAITAGTDTSPLAGVADDDESGDEISDTGLTDARSDTDSDAEDAEVERSLSHARTPSKSPAIKVVLLPLEDPQMSPNVTVRRERSMSRSTASTRSTRSNKQIAKSASKASRKLSFSEIGALDSSPTSVAASIGRRSFDALDSSSEDDDANEVLENGNIARPSPSREIAARQLRYTRVQEEDSSMSEDEVLDLSSSPTHGPVDSIDRNEEASPVPLVTSTPARLMTTLALDSTHSVAAASATVPVNVSTPNPRRSAVASPRPASSPQIDSDRFTAPPSIEVPQDSSLVALAELDAPSLKGREEADLPDPKIESSQEFQEPEQHESVTGSDAHEDTDSLLDLSATLDEARPRTALIVPPLSLSARPSPARSTRSSGVKAADANPSSTVIIPTVSTPLASDSEEAPSREGRSQSIVSRQESVTSQASTVVQVSSADPMAAARAAAILKVHHHYIQEGTWPAGVNPLSRAASGSSEEGERALDDLLKQAEREVSAALQEQSTVLQAGVESSQDESSLEVAMSIYPEEQRERSMSASRHFIDQSKLEVWTRHDWRALEQCFIDELRRKRSSRDPVEPAEVVRLYLESEQLQPEQCTGEWKPEKLEVRVQALIARKQQKSAGRTHRERSHSVASSAYSRAPSDFFQEEDAHLQSYQTNESNPDATYLDIPGALLSPGRRRYARSAEPIVPEKPNAQQDYARHRGVSKYQSLQRRMPLHKPLSRETSLSSVAEAEETQSVASEPPPSNVARSLSRLYPSLEELKSEMRPKKLLPVRGRSVAAAVNLFEKIEEEQSIEAHWEQAWLKRKPSETDLRGLHDSSKRVRI